MLPVDTPNHQKPRFINRYSRDLDQVRVVPDRLRLDEVDPVLFVVRTTFSLVKLKRQYGIKTIPLLLRSQLPGRGCLGGF